ncbi:hypothetical protein BGZ58_004296 [Dissophora ornata]|nr:hypothetical protein BGZ58_004296 [Dissophora ornata]
MARHGLLTPAGAKVVAGLILNYTLPALLFAKMLTCVSMDNIEELGFVALVAVFYIALGAFMGFLMQRTRLIPKRLYWGIVAATMFTNFGDLPISIILAVSDHPPFLVGDGARGTAYSSVFISVFYLFLFPLGGYRLIRYDHVKESKRLANLTVSLQEYGEGLRRSDQSLNARDCTLTGDSMSTPPNRQQYLSSSTLGAQHHHPHYLKQDPNGLQSSFSATSTMISMDYIVDENNAIELRYRPHDHEMTSSPKGLMDSPRDDATMVSSPREMTSPFVNDHQTLTHCGGSSSSSGNEHSSPSFSHCHPHHPASYPMQILNASENLRYSLESMASNGTGVTRISMGHEDNHSLIQPITKAREGSRSAKKKSFRSPTIKEYQPPPLHHPTSPYSSSSSSSSNGPGSAGSPSPSRFNLLTPYNPLSPMVSSTHRRLPAGGESGAGGPQVPEIMATIPLSDLSPSLPDPLTSVESLPKVPPALQNAYKSKLNTQANWFWRIFHATREYLTPPTIGLLLGLLAALTPLRGLFIATAHSLPSPDELPPLSFILEITLMLGGCCVPLGLTVLGASLSRLKPGRMRPLIPALTMITVAKLVISPFIGITLVQLVLVRQYGWISSQNHMLQFTLMLMSGSPTSITCFVLAQVWDRRTKNAGGEMAALIAVQYAVATVLLTIGSAFMMYFLF